MHYLPIDLGIPTGISSFIGQLDREIFIAAMLLLLLLLLQLQAAAACTCTFWSVRRDARLFIKGGRQSLSFPPEPRKP